MKTIKILISTIFQNGGEATRALEIAKIIKKSKLKNYNVNIIFLSRGSSFDKKVLNLGFSLHKAKPLMKGVNFLEDFQSKFGELIGETALAESILKGEIDAYFGALAPATYAMNKLGMSNIKIAAPTQYQLDLSIGVRKDWLVLLNILNKSIATISNKQRQSIKNK